MIMDQSEFIRRLEELAELKRQKVPKGPGLREAEYPDKIFRHGYEFDISVDDNPTQSYVIHKLKQHPRACEDCGDVCVDRRVERKLNTSPTPHWKSRCTACNLYLDPTTGKFELNGWGAKSVYQSLYTPKKPRKKSQGDK